MPAWFDFPHGDAGPWYTIPYRDRHRTGNLYVTSYGVSAPLAAGLLTKVGHALASQAELLYAG